MIYAIISTYYLTALFFLLGLSEPYEAMYKSLKVKNDNLKGVLALIGVILLPFFVPFYILFNNE